MNINNKKILIGFIVIFVLGLNIYNIPLKGDDSDAFNQIESLETIDKPFDLDQFNVVVNKNSSDEIIVQNYKKIIVTFWATWCPSCRRENLIFNKVSKTFKEDLLILAISVDKDPNALAVYLKETPLNFPSFYNNKEIAVMFDDILAVPTHYIIDVKSGKVRKTMGLMSENEISDIMKEKL